jgi:hypothetical protein
VRLTLSQCGAVRIVKCASSSVLRQLGITLEAGHRCCSSGNFPSNITPEWGLQFIPLKSHILANFSHDNQFLA